jgi:hypothetical protein
MIALDGNAIAGDLIEAPGADFAAAKRACASCGMAGFFFAEASSIRVARRRTVEGQT